MLHVLGGYRLGYLLLSDLRNESIGVSLTTEETLLKTLQVIRAAAIETRGPRVAQGPTKDILF
jgi:hypothetical protein